VYFINLALGEGKELLAPPIRRFILIYILAAAHYSMGMKLAPLTRRRTCVAARMALAGP
jgi:hypothetical protein